MPNVLMIHRLSCTFWDTNIFDQFLNMLGWGSSDRANYKSYDEIDKHSQKTNSLWRNTQPVVFAVCQELKMNDVTESEANSADHPGNGSLFVYPLRENTHD